MNQGIIMKGALVFLAAFALFLVISLGYADLPPGRQIYDAVVGQDIGDYTNLVIGVFNGAVWGVIVYLIYWILADYVFKKEPTATINVKT